MWELEVVWCIIIISWLRKKLALGTVMTMMVVVVDTMPVLVVVVDTVPVLVAVMEEVG